MPVFAPSSSLNSSSSFPFTSSSSFRPESLSVLLSERFSIFVTPLVLAALDEEDSDDILRVEAASITADGGRGRADVSTGEAGVDAAAEARELSRASNAGRLMPNVVVDDAGTGGGLATAGKCPVADAAAAESRAARVCCS